MQDMKLQDMEMQDMKMHNMKMYWHILHRHDKHEKQTHSYCSYRIIETFSEQSLQWLVKTESYERFYILPRIVPTYFAIYYRG